MAVSPKHKAIFIHITKTAGCSVEAAFDQPQDHLSASGRLEAVGPEIEMFGYKFEESPE